MKEKIKKHSKGLMRILKKEELQILPGSVAYYFLMSFIPIIAIASLIASLINKDINFINIFESNLPNGLSHIFTTFVNSSYSSGSIIVLIVGYLIMGLNGPKAFIIASDTLYDFDRPNAIKLKLKAGILTIMIILIMIFAVFIPIFGNFILKIILGNIIYNKVASSYFYEMIKIIICFVVIYLIVFFIYLFSPDGKIKAKDTALGALFTSSTWIIFSFLFSIYITRFAKYDALYGNFANVIILLLWIYFLAYLFVIGLSINVNIYRNRRVSS